MSAMFEKDAKTFILFWWMVDEQVLDVVQGTTTCKKLGETIEILTTQCFIPRFISVFQKQPKS